MTKSFSAQVFDWNKLTEKQSTAVFKQSSQDVLAATQLPTAKGGRMRVDTGFLRNSHYSGLNGNTSSEGPESYVLAIAGAKLGDEITGGWSASYALPREEKDAFLASAAQNWTQIVQRNVNKLKR